MGCIDDKRQYETAIPLKFSGTIFCWDLKYNYSVEFSELFYVGQDGWIKFTEPEMHRGFGFP